MPTALGDFMALFLKQCPARGTVWQKSREHLNLLAHLRKTPQKNRAHLYRQKRHDFYMKKGWPS